MPSTTHTKADMTPVLPQRPLKGHENCMGAVVSEYFVLTAAHCFTVEDQKHSIKVNVGKDAVRILISGPMLRKQTCISPVLSTAPPFCPKGGKNKTQMMLWGQSQEAAYINTTPLFSSQKGTGRTWRSKRSYSTPNTTSMRKRQTGSLSSMTTMWLSSSSRPS